MARDILTRDRVVRPIPFSSFAGRLLIPIKACCCEPSILRYYEQPLNTRTITAERGSDRAHERSDGSHGGQGQHEDEMDLKEREYRDSEGNVHHHTKKYLEEHPEDKGRPPRPVRVSLGASRPIMQAQAAKLRSNGAVCQIVPGLQVGFPGVKLQLRSPHYWNEYLRSAFPLRMRDGWSFAYSSPLRTAVAELAG